MKKSLRSDAYRLLRLGDILAERHCHCLSHSKHGPFSSDIVWFAVFENKTVLPYVYLQGRK